jgi:hypothetical protein
LIENQLQLNSMGASMKGFLLISLVFWLSVPSEAEVLVYKHKQTSVEFKYESGVWEQQKHTYTGYTIEDVNENRINTWIVNTRLQKDINGRVWKFAEANYAGEFSFIKAQVGKKLMWVISGTTGNNDQIFQTGQARSAKIGDTNLLIAAKLTGTSIYNTTADDNRTIGSAKTTLFLDKNRSADVSGLTAQEAVEQIVGYLVSSKGYVDCNANPCLCNTSWATGTAMLTARGSFAAGVIDGKIYVFGGHDRSKTLKSTEVFNPATNQWSYLADNNNRGTGASGLTSAVVDGKLYVFGGWGDRTSGTINFNEMYAPDTNTWTTLTQKPTPVFNAVAVVYESKIYLFGGYNNGDYYRVVERYDPMADTWSYITDIPRKVAYFAIAVSGSKAYMFGGTNTESWGTYHDVISYDFETGLWNTSGLTHLPRDEDFHTNSAAPVIDGKVYVIGGQKLDVDSRWNFSTIYGSDIYNPVTNKLGKGPLLPVPRIDYAIVAIGQKIYVLGGQKNTWTSSHPVTDVFVLDTQPCSD